jgi:hypothetical protein
MSQDNLWYVYRKVEIWSLRIGLVLVWLGIAGSHHTWVATVGAGLIVISILASLVRFVRRRHLNKGTQMSGEGR